MALAAEGRTTHALLQFQLPVPPTRRVYVEIRDPCRKRQLATNSPKLTIDEYCNPSKNP